jgi:hypothetical protein
VYLKKIKIFKININSYLQKIYILDLCLKKKQDKNSVIEWEPDKTSPDKTSPDITSLLNYIFTLLLIDMLRKSGEVSSVQ